jgi:hypothetical protein
MIIIYDNLFCFMAVIFVFVVSCNLPYDHPTRVHGVVHLVYVCLSAFKIMAILLRVSYFFVGSFDSSYICHIGLRF